MRVNLILVTSVLTLLSSSSALAEKSPSELLVRLKNQDGVVRLKYSNETEAQNAKFNLLSSGQATSVAPNLLYRPALTRKFHEVAQAVESMKALLAPLADMEWGQPVGEIPAVLLPTGQIQDGADPMTASDWAVQKINMPSVDAVRSFQSSSNHIIAAVIDTGVDYNHEDLVDAMWRSPGNPQVVGYDFAHNNATPFDLRHFDLNGCLNDSACKLGQNQDAFLSNPGHGTHCAGHVGAVANNTIGIRGVGGNVQVMALKFFYDAGEPNAGAGDDAAAIQSIDYAIQNGVKVISASWGGREKKAVAAKSELKKALQRAQQAGVLVVIAAGNDGIDQDNVPDPDFPAFYNFDNLIVVAASDQNDQIADFSNYGATSVHIAAPGVKILSTTTGGTLYNDVVAAYTDSSGKAHEMDWDGTSMATPIVAGAAALVWSKYPQENYSQIRDRILKSARQVQSLSGKVVTGGVLDVTAALN